MVVELFALPYKGVRTRREKRGHIQFSKSNLRQHHSIQKILLRYHGVIEID